MRSFLLFVALIAGAASAQLNYTGVNDTVSFSDFRADSLAFGRALLVNGGKNKAVLIIADDTSSAGHRSDSIKIKYGIYRDWETDRKSVV